VDNPKIRIPLTVSERQQPVPMAVGQRQQQIPLQVSGGSGGTRDYNKLKNKPAINGHELVDNQTASDLGLATPDDINIFTARYGVTTENELSAALNDKKYIYAVGNSIPYQLYALSDVKFGSEAMVGDGYVFTFCRFDGTVLKRIACRYGHWITLEDIDLAETGGQPIDGVYVTDSQGHSWYAPMGESDDAPVILDENGDAWHLLPGTGGEDDIAVTDGNGNDWHFARAEDSGGLLPPGGTDGQYLVKDSTAEGGARWADLPVFEPTAGAWSVTPLVEAETTLHTAGNYLDRDIVVEAIPYAEVSNISGGMTATIGG